MVERRAGLVFGLSALILVYGLGALTARFDLFPYPFLSQAFNQVQDFAEHWRHDLGLEPTRYLVPATGQGRRTPVLDDPERAMPGLRAVVGLFAGEPLREGAILLDRSGRELHAWLVDRDRIRREYPAVTFASNAVPHGFEVLPDGSVVFGFTGGGGGPIVRQDACGRVQWATPGTFHHDIDLLADGTLIALGGPGEYDAISRLDLETGALRSISVLDDAAMAAVGKGMLFIRRSDDPDNPEWLIDPHHFNDADVLRADMAAAFPQFEAGDILLSMRNLNLVMVVDGDDLGAKWWQHGPWHRQHDPDFQPNGRISIYDNNMHGTSSRIVEIDPVSSEMEVLFEGSDEIPFYSYWGGKHQVLDNGNVLLNVVEPTGGGRIIEVTRDGKLVWEFHNAFDATRNLMTTNARLIGEDFFEAGALICPATT
jgi:hypothetical protein